MSSDTGKGVVVPASEQIEVDRDIRTEVASAKYAAVAAGEYKVSAELRDAWEALRGAWDNLEFDKYYGGNEDSFRQRRYTDFTFDPIAGTVELPRNKEYFQSKEQNSYVGGIKRKFGGVLPETYENQFFQELVRFSFAQFPIPEQYANQAWTCQVHQIRITVGGGETTDITPEGVHTDGYPFASVYLVEREGVNGAQSSVYEWDETELASLTFSDPLDSLYLVDREMKHYVTPMSAAGDAPGRRGILAISFSLPGSPFTTDE